MRSLEQHERGLAVRLAALAGFVDSIGFLLLGGLFVSFMLSLLHLSEPTIP